MRQGTFNKETVFVASGWRRIDDGSRPGGLQSVSVPWFSDKDCKEIFHWSPVKLIETMICTNELGFAGNSSCRGDSGGKNMKINILFGGQGSSSCMFLASFPDDWEISEYIFL